MGTTLAFSDVNETNEHAQQNVEREINRRLPKYPFRHALEECSAHPKKDPNRYATHRVRSARPKKTRSHQQPAHPQKRQDDETADTHFTGGERRQAVRRRSLWIITIPPRRNFLTRLLIRPHVRDEIPAQPGTVFVAHPIRPVIQSTAERRILRDCGGVVF